MTPKKAPLPPEPPPLRQVRDGGYGPSSILVIVMILVLGAIALIDAGR